MHFKTKKKNTRLGWGLYVYREGAYSYVSKDKWPPGLRDTMTREEADKVLKSLNTEARLMKEELRSLGAKERLTIEGERECAWLPQDVVERFEATYIGPRRSTKGYAKLVSMWLLAKRMIKDVGMFNWGLNTFPVFEWWRGKAHSADYVRRVIRLASLYGYQYADMRGTAFRGLESTSIPEEIKISMEEEFESKKSLPLHRPQLLKLKQKLSPEEYSWVLVAWAFGLRPEEVDLLHVPIDPKGRKNWWFERDVLVIDQPKLRKVRKRERYKRIPIFTIEQQAAKSIIMAYNHVRPSLRRVRGTFPSGVTLYGCRHGFTHYMQGLGQPLSTISGWLGHRSLKTTEQHYKDHGLLIKAKFKKAG